jgi:hydrogenase maturation factor
MFLERGKLPPEVLAGILKAHASGLPEDVRVGPAVGEDAAVLESPYGLIVVASDPVTFVTEGSGYTLVTVNANDVAVMGARPRFFLFTLLLPEGRTEGRDVETVFREVSEALEDIGAFLIGGHTEVTAGIDRPLAMGTMIGVAEEETLVTSVGAEPGDVLAMTKGIAIEGTSILAREKASELEGIVSPDILRRMQDFHRDPGISVVREALALASLGIPTAMHDPTEGGMAMGAAELAGASSVGLHLMKREIPVYPETLEVCRAFDIDPMGLISSGTLIFSCPVERLESAEKALMSLHVPMAVIGEVREKAYGLKIETERGLEDLRYSSRDELTKAL